MNDHLMNRMANSLVPRVSESMMLSALGMRPDLRDQPVPRWRLEGTPQEIGSAEGRQAADLPRLLRVMGGAAGFFQWWRPGRIQAWIDGLPPDHRAELDAIAATARVGGRQILRTNVIVDTFCSVLVSMPTANQPLRIARNMDFFPAGVTGPATVVKRYRPVGRRAFTAISWPGYAGVVSGMNEAGVVACVLLHHAGGTHPAGMPVTFRLREILEQCRDLESAVACFARSPVASEHYALLADADSAAVVWRSGDRIRRADPEGGRLAIDNSPRDDQGRPLGHRARHLQSSAVGDLDAAAVRALTGASCQSGTNAQAMTFCPVERRIDLAIGTAWRPAAWEPWWSYGEGDPVALGRSVRLPHHHGVARVAGVAALAGL